MFPFYPQQMQMDPRMLEMQANYLRFLASCYTDGGFAAPRNLNPAPSMNYYPYSQVSHYGAPAQATYTPQDRQSQPPPTEIQEKVPVNPVIESRKEELIRESVGECVAEMMTFSPPRNSGTKSRTQPPIMNANPIDDVPIKAHARTFEELLEEEIRKSETNETVASENLPKRNFLKRKSNARPPASPSKAIKKIEKPREEPDIEQVKEPKPKQTFLKRGSGKQCMPKNDTTQQKFQSPYERTSLSSEEPEIRLSYGNTSKQSLLEQELATEIQKNRLESEQLSKLRSKLREFKKKIENDARELAKAKENELEGFSVWKQQQTERFKSTNRGFESTNKSTKRETEELDSLRKNIDTLEETLEDNEEHYETILDELKVKTRELTLKLKQGKQELPKLTVTPPLQSSKQTIRSETITEDGKINRIYETGKKEIILNNGFRKEILPSGEIIVYFINKDVKKTFPDGRISYLYAETQTTQLTFPDGLQIFQFANGQIEKHYPDHSKEITFTDGIVRCIFPDGVEESIFPDGSVQKVDENGVTYIDFVNGQKDTLFPDGTKIRELPDGRIRKIMPDGRVFENN